MAYSSFKRIKQLILSNHLNTNVKKFKLNIHYPHYSCTLTTFCEYCQVDLKKA